MKDTETRKACRTLSGIVSQIEKSKYQTEDGFHFIEMNEAFIELKKIANMQANKDNYECHVCCGISTSFPCESSVESCEVKPLGCLYSLKGTKPNWIKINP